MSDDEEADLSLLQLLRQSLGINDNPSTAPPVPETGVLASAEYIYNNSIDVAIDSSSTKHAATTIYNLMQSKQYSTHSWSAHSLHPQTKDEATLNFIFTMDLLNFSFWSERSEEDRFAVEYRDQRWTGYWALVACLRRAVDEGWSDGGGCNA
jgi:Potential Queuosine, Q, salvage protein family